MRCSLFQPKRGPPKFRGMRLRSKEIIRAFARGVHGGSRARTDTAGGNRLIARDIGPRSRMRRSGCEGCERRGEEATLQSAQRASAQKDRRLTVIAALWGAVASSGPGRCGSSAAVLALFAPRTCLEGLLPPRWPHIISTSAPRLRRSPRRDGTVSCASQGGIAGAWFEAASFLK